MSDAIVHEIGLAADPIRARAVRQRYRDVWRPRSTNATSINSDGTYFASMSTSGRAA
jgi:hypothetical protein